MNFFEVLAHQALEAKTPFLWLAVVAALVAARLSRHAVRFKALVFFAVMHHLLLLIGAALSAGGSPMAEAFEVPALVSGGVAFVGAVGVVVFELALPRMRLSVPPIVQDVVVAVVSILTAVVVASRAGVNLSGIIATSAVITAVLGFSLQDVIASVASGLALQMDSSMEVGDWVQVGDVRGRVSDIRWRFTAIETRTWETVLVPNFVMLRSPVTVLGKRTGHPQLWRRTVTFSVGFNVPPTDVIDVVQSAVRGAGLANVAAEPAPSVIVANLDGSACAYQVRYWLKDFAADDPTDSEVLTRVYFALQRAGLELSLPTQAVHVTEESEERQSVKTQRQVERRRALLDAVPLFSALSPEERGELARSLKYAPFTRGEVMTKQGAEAHWLYLIEEGTASVRVSDGVVERDVTTLQAGTYFGEMSLLTGRPRSATVVAETDVECFRLDKVAFQRVLEKRPELAKEVAAALSQRTVELEAVKEGLDARSASERRQTHERAFFTQIRRFFGLGT